METFNLITTNQEDEMNIKIEERLENLGLTEASKKIKSIREFKAKTLIAYEHFRYVKPEKIIEFNKKLMEETHQEFKGGYGYKTLVFIPLEKYTEVPPENVLTAIESAIEKKCFDYFEVAKIESVVVIPDPIVFGVIKNCPDKFFIAQWDDDVSIEQILKENEG